jgi:hypothetical protein
MQIEEVRNKGMLCAIFVRAGKLKRIKHTSFITENERVLQSGMVAHPAGYVENIHYHKERKRTIKGVEQMLFMVKGRMAVDFFDWKSRKKFRSVILTPGDMMLIIDGIHRIRVLKDASAATVKLGPYVSPKEDKVDINEK